MVHRRVKPGKDYRARLRDAVGAAQDGDTIVVSNLQDAFLVYSEGLKSPERSVELACESPWAVYRLLPDMRAALRAATLDGSTADSLLASVVAALHDWGRPKVAQLTAWYESFGVVLVAWAGVGDPYRCLAYLIPEQAIGCLLVYAPDGEPVEPPDGEAYGPLHIEGRPVAVLVLNHEAKGAGA